ncbi:MAG: response regulator transcription factor [Marinilabiliaceae bacterium]|nr:response regulator transcription factor [Marinilabiliaceae bacterium]
MIKAVIIDDEPELREVNRRLLKDNFPEIEVVGEAGSVNDAVELISKTNPKIVLLDIEIEGGTGFNVLQKIDNKDFKTIFITAFNQFAIKAIKFSALDYILKPVNEFEFCAAIKNAIEVISNNEVQMNHLLKQVEKEERPQKLVLRTSEAMFLVNISDVMYCKSDNSYTTFYILDQKEILVSKGIKEYSDMLEEYHFFRPHQSFLVNLDYISRIDKSDGGFIIMKNGKEIPISSRRKPAMMQLLDKF